MAPNNLSMLTNGTRYFWITFNDSITEFLDVDARRIVGNRSFKRFVKKRYFLDRPAV